YGQVVATGNVNLAGTLQVALLNGFTPQPADRLTIIDNRGGGAIHGTFAGLPEGGLVNVGPYAFQIRYAGAASNAVTLTVLPSATTATVTSSAAPSVFGQPVSFTATVAGPGSAAPTGSVDFVDTTTGTDLGSVSLSGGSAALTTPALGVGS